MSRPTQRTAAVICGTILILAMLGCAMWLCTHGHADYVGIILGCLLMVFFMSLI